METRLAIEWQVGWVVGHGLVGESTKLLLGCHVYPRPGRNSSATFHTLFHYACSSLNLSLSLSLAARENSINTAAKLCWVLNTAVHCVDHAHIIEWQLGAAGGAGGGGVDTFVLRQMQLSVKFLRKAFANAVGHWFYLSLPKERKEKKRIATSNWSLTILFTHSHLSWGMACGWLPARQVLNERQHLGQRGTKKKP